MYYERSPFMANQHNQEVINQILELLSELQPEEPKDAKEPETPSMPTTELLTIKECLSVVKGISAHTIRKLVAQGRVRYIRTGEGTRGKILINKRSLLEYINGVA